MTRRPGCNLKHGCKASQYCTSMSQEVLGRCEENSVTCPKIPFASELLLMPNRRGVLGSVATPHCKPGSILYTTSPENPTKSLICSKEGWVLNDGSSLPTLNPFFCQEASPNSKNATCKSELDPSYNGAIQTQSDGKNVFRCTAGHKLHPKFESITPDMVNVTCFSGTWHTHAVSGNSISIKI